MHLVVGIIGIATRLILNKCEPTLRVNYIRVVTNGAKGLLTDETQQFLGLGYHNGPNGRSYEDLISFSVPSNREVLDRFVDESK